jgi:ankyrin repeat protein
VAVRPLRIEELAEVLAVDFDDVEGVPTLRADWRWGDQEQALLSSCSSLIAIVDAKGSRVVQFSHFSVKEFLTSPRLATSSGNISRYHIDLGPAHTILAQTCLGALLQLDGPVDKKEVRNTCPLAEYAAQHWVDHAQFENVSTQIQRAMEYLFDPHRPHFGVWLGLYDIDTQPSNKSHFIVFFSYPEFGAVPGATPLYYAALCGFHGLAKHLISKYPQHANSYGGWYSRPLVAALAGNHLQTAETILRGGADPNVRNRDWRIPLHCAAYFGDLEVVQKLMEYGADIDARDKDGWTPLYLASEGVNLKDPAVIQLLLDHGADVNARTGDRSTPLHVASRWGAVEVASLLLAHGADVEAEDDWGRTPLMEAKRRGRNNIVSLLFEYCAK